MLYTFLVLLSVPVTVICFLACALCTSDVLRLYRAAQARRKAQDDLTYVESCCGRGACVRARLTSVL